MAHLETFVEFARYELILTIAIAIAIKWCLSVRFAYLCVWFVLLSYNNSIASVFEMFLLKLRYDRIFSLRFFFY